MIRFEAKSLGTVTLRFRHNKPNIKFQRNNDLVAMVNGLKFTRGNTECLMEILPTGETLPENYFGEAYTHPADQYKKETGRVLALQRAIEGAELTDQQSREVMAGYYSR
jgi:hypothetical protein